MTQVIKVSKQGIDVGTATNPNDFIFDSTINTFKIIAQGTHAPTLGTTETELTSSIAHGQGAIPFVFAFCKFSDGRVGIPGESSGTNPGGFWFSNLSVDGTNINFNYLNFTGGNYSPVFRYIICEPPL